MTKSERELLESIDEKLSGVLRLMAESSVEEGTNKEKVKKLHSMGFDNQEMAEIIGTTKSTVSSALTDLRNEGEIDD